MPTNVTLPQLGESVTEGTVTRWLKSVGDTVKADEPLVEISTDKVDTEIPAPASGVLLEIAAPVDAVIAVGATLAVIGDSGDSAASAATQAAPAAPVAAAAPPVAPPPAPPAPPVVATPPAPVVSATPVPATPVTQPTVSTPVAPVAPPVAAPAAPATVAAPAASNGHGSANGNAYASPLVRKLANENNIDLATITGTGLGGRITREDLLATISKTPSAPLPPSPTPVAAPNATPVAAVAPSVNVAATQPAVSTPIAPAAGPTPAQRGKTEKLTRLRRVIAERMVESLKISAQLTTVVEVDMTRIAHLRDRTKGEFLKREGIKLTFMPFLAKASLEGLTAYPQLNATLNADATEVTYHAEENLGVAVDTERGLLVPVIRNAGDLSIAGLARRINDIAERTRNGDVTPDELSGGTFTLTNTGSRGALFDTPIINQPQVAILGTGAVVKRPAVVKDDQGDESIAIRAMAYLALTYDHRLVDGADAARFLSWVKNRLENIPFDSDLIA